MAAISQAELVTAIAVQYIFLSKQHLNDACSDAAKLGALRFLATRVEDSALLAGDASSFLFALARASSKQLVTGLCDFAYTSLDGMGTPDQLADLLKALQSLVGPVDSTQPLQAVITDDEATSSPQGQVSLPGLIAPGTMGVARQSALGLLLRRINLAISASLFDGLLLIYESIPTILSALAGVHARLTATDGDDSNLTPTAEAKQEVGEQSTGPASHRARYLAALHRGDYRVAIDALHALFDTGYGAGVGGRSPGEGLTTAIGLLTRSGPHAQTSDRSGTGQSVPLPPALSGLLSGPFGRVRELLIAAASPPTVGGVGLGRTLLHYPLLQLAATELWFGHVASATTAVRECLRTAHAAGDGPAAALALELLAECEAMLSTTEDDGSHEDDGPDGNGGDAVGTQAWRSDVASRIDPHAQWRAFASVAHRAAEASMWRQGVGATIKASELRVLTLANQQRAKVQKSNAVNQPLAVQVPGWLTLEPSVASRAGSFGIGSIPGSNGASEGALSGSSIKDSPLVPPTVALSNAHARRIKAKESMPGISSLNAGLMLTLPPGGAPSAWSVPRPLTAVEVMQAHSDAHTSRARCFDALGITAMAQVASACADVARQAANCAQGVGLESDFTASKASAEERWSKLLADL